jgi:hypothetical protein
MRMTYVFFLVLLAVPLAAQPARVFDTPEEAAQALIAAAEKNDTSELLALLGPNGKALLTSGNPQQDEKERAEFVRLARGKHRLEPDPMNKNKVFVDVGSEDWPFPAPVVRSANGKWAFDASRGAMEVRARRVGANELDAIEICAGYVQAQKQYAMQDHDRDGLLEYASRIQSSSGTHDGLYWDGPKPLVPKAFAQAEVEKATSKAKPYHGYYFRVLKAQGPSSPGGEHNYLVKNGKEIALIGGFGLVAWPAQYGASGIHTFIVSADGVVFEKDLKGAPVDVFDPDASWHRVQ